MNARMVDNLMRYHLNTIPLSSILSLYTQLILKNRIIEGQNQKIQKVEVLLEMKLSWVNHYPRHIWRYETLAISCTTLIAVFNCIDTSIVYAWDTSARSTDCVPFACAPNTTNASWNSTTWIYRTVLPPPFFACWWGCYVLRGWWSTCWPISQVDTISDNYCERKKKDKHDRVLQILHLHVCNDEASRISSNRFPNRTATECNWVVIIYSLKPEHWISPQAIG